MQYYVDELLFIFNCYLFLIFILVNIL